VRFNAKKRAIGKYLSTTIWEFSMNCHHCSNMLIIRTDPKSTEYEVGEGLERKKEDFDK